MENLPLDGGFPAEVRLLSTLAGITRQNDNSRPPSDFFPIPQSPFLYLQCLLLDGIS